jgi:putative two-component system response regulator
MPHILIVDDEFPQRALLRAILERDPAFTFSEAISGQQALEMAQATLPDLILLDIMMPGLNGVETCQRLKADPVLHRVPVILVSALPLLASQAFGMEAGADAVIGRPVEIAELKTQVYRALDNRYLG